MDREALRAAKAQMVAQMQTGQSWHEAATNAGLQTSRATAYRLLHRVRTEGVVALDDQRHGHPMKLRQPVRDWLTTFYRAAPASTGRTVQAALLERLAWRSVSDRSIASARPWVSAARRRARGKNQPNGPHPQPTW